MCTIPLDLERRLEQRWAARFLRPVSPAATPKHWLEERTQQLAAPGKGNRQDRPAGLDFVAIKLARTRLKRRLVESRRQRSFESREATRFHVKGMEAKHMTWWKKSEPTEAWEIEDEEKIGDLELARYARSAILLPTALKQFPSFIMVRPLKRKNAKLIDMNVPRSVPKRR